MALERRYWDSACFISILSREAGRVEVCAPILRAVELRALEIVTSAWTITEVLHPKGGTPLSASVRATVKSFFHRSGIILVNVDRRIAENAQEYFWDCGVRPKDAIHVACAIEANAPVFETYDSGLIKLSGKLGGSPTLEIREPQPVSGATTGAGVQPRAQGDLLDGANGEAEE
jgi:predicted nucleic acid-binding protein